MRHADAQQRLIVFDAVHNFRDLGGYPTADGGTRGGGGVLFRADTLHRGTEADLEVLRDLGLRTIIDLRTPRELEDDGRIAHVQHPVVCHHLPIIDSTREVLEAPTFDDKVDVLAWAYRLMLDRGRARFIAALEVLGEPGALPAVFHCAAGKDRTGLLAALVLTALGVPRQYVLDDYALTVEAMERRLAWAEREDPALFARYKTLIPGLSEALADSMRLVLESLDDQHGSVIEYLLHSGLRDDALARLRAALVVPAAV